MKKLCIIFLLLCFIYIGLSTIFSFRKKGYTTSYFIQEGEKTIEVIETFSKNVKNETDHYIFQIVVNDIRFPIRTSHQFSKGNKIKKIKYIKDQKYTCVYPIFQNDVMLTDVLCEKGGMIYPYQTMIGVSTKIDQFVMGIGNQFYQYPSDSKQLVGKIQTVSLYSNLPKNHYLALENYKGLYLANGSTITSHSLFSTDRYERPIQLFFKQYYLTADYNQDYEFHEFYGFDFIIKKEFKIVSNQAISMNSYIQGIVGDSIYLIDRNHKKQYRINWKQKKVSQIGSVKRGIQIYTNGKWETQKMQEALDENIYFSEQTIQSKIENQSYDHIDFINGYYYMYQKNESGYAVYRALSQYLENPTYLLSVSDYRKVQYVEDYLYFIEDNQISYYHDGMGIQVVLEDSELSFNGKLSFGVTVN